MKFILMNKHEKILLKKLKLKVKNEMQGVNMFHDFVHTENVYKNVEKLLKYERGNKLVLLTVALFHDIKRDGENHEIEGAKYTEQILKDIPEFPQNLIESIAQIIAVHDNIKKQITPEQKIFNDADKMDAFSELGIIRSFMMYAKNGLSLKDACLKYLDLIDNFYHSLYTDSAKKIVHKKYLKTKRFALKLIKNYK